MGMLSRLSDAVLRPGITGLTFAQVLIYLPLTLDIAGKDAFLALSLALATYFGATATLSLIARNTHFAFISTLFWLWSSATVPALLLLCLNLYHSNSSSLTGRSNSAVENSYWAYRILVRLPGWWEAILRWTSPVFVLCEGIATLLVIQTCGQFSRFFIEERSESWQMVFLFTSATTYVLSAYFLWGIYDTAAKEPINATLIGVSVTSVLFLSGIAFGMKRGSVVETSLMLAYVVYNVYYLSGTLDPMSFLRPFKTAEPPLPPVILQSFSAVVSLASHLFGQGFDFIAAASSALPLPVFVGLIYRIAVMYTASRVLIALKRGRAGGYDESTRLSEEEPMARLFTLVLYYSRFFLVAVYTHLLMLDADGQVFWRWLNVFQTVCLFGVEILLTRDDSDLDAVLRGFRLKED